MSGVTMDKDNMVEKTEDNEVAELMDKWADELAEYEQDDDEEEGDDGKPSSAQPSAFVADYDNDEEDRELHRQVFVDDNALDHIVLACSDFERGMDKFEELTGIRPVMVSVYNGLGCKSARISFADTVFLEVVAPDPKQTDLQLYKDLLALPEDTFVPFHYAVRNKRSVEMKKKEFPDMGFEPDHITMYGRDGKGLWKWEQIILMGHDKGGLVPIFMEWGSAEHACAKLPVIGELKAVTVTSPAESPVHTVLKGVDGLNVEVGDDQLRFEFTSPMGTHEFISTNPTGIRFPMA